MGDDNAADGVLTLDAKAPAETEPERRHRPDVPLLAGLAVAVALNVLVARDISVPFCRPAAGFWFVVVAPSWLLFTAQVWPRDGTAERLGYSVAGTLLLLMTAGLAINTALPAVGLARPLDTDPVLVAADVVNVALYVLRWRHGRAACPLDAPWRTAIAAVTRAEFRLLMLGAAAVTLVVAGANRLNNGAGDGLTLAALATVTLTLILLLRWARTVRDSAAAAVIYLLSLAVLLSTSLRGWSVTGHDIQEEYRVFQLTAAHGRWDMAYFHDAYNACLSITVLPTELDRITGVDGAYVYKVFFQLVFALVPVLVYVIARRYASPFHAVLAVAYFIGFPTFFTDMPFLNRQETAFLFVAVAILVITSPALNSRQRQLGLLLAGAGVELSHYSTMYVFMGMLMLALLARYVRAVSANLGHPHKPKHVEIKRVSIRPGAVRAWLLVGTACTVTIGSVAVLAVLTFAWGDLATGTSGAVYSAAGSMVTALGGGSSASGGGRSQNTSFSLLGGQAPSPAQVLADYRVATIAARASAPAGFYLPLSAAGAATPVVTPAVRPLTGIGRALQDAGLPVAALNAALRDLTADAEQLFLLAGMAWLLLSGRHRTRPELFWLCAGNVGVVALLTVLPSLSADYGVLRAFQEALMVIAPVVVAGSVVVFSPLGPRRSQLAAAAVCLGLFATTTGLLPQLLGGNLAELNLNNSGSYYDIYYTHPQEQAAVGWLGQQPGVLNADIQASYTEDKFAFTRPALVNGREAITDIYPAGVLSQSWLIAGYSMLRSGVAYTSYDGDLLEYLYPWPVLDDNKNLVYDNGGAEIYK
jgi:uncharacterized membrane protein